MNQLVQSFKNQIRQQTLESNVEQEGPESIVVPQLKDQSITRLSPNDQWDQYDSHKFFECNIVKEYVTNRLHLPQPQMHLNPKVQEAFMTLNLLRTDPKYLINYILEPLKKRFIDDPIKPPYLAKSCAKFKFNSFSFGTIKMQNGPEIIDEIIAELQSKQYIKPLEWNDALEEASLIRIEPLGRKFLDKNALEKLQLRRPLHGILTEVGAESIQSAHEMFFTKSQFGFETILMLLIDDKNADRRNRRILLSPKQRFIGMAQIYHSQLDFLNGMVICQDLHTDFVQVEREARQLDVTGFVRDNKFDSRLIQPLGYDGETIAQGNTAEIPIEYLRDHYYDVYGCNQQFAQTSIKPSKWGRKNDGIIDFGVQSSVELLGRTTPKPDLINYLV